MEDKNWIDIEDWLPPPGSRALIKLHDDFRHRFRASNEVSAKLMISPDTGNYVWVVRDGIKLHRIDNDKNNVLAWTSLVKDPQSYIVTNMVMSLDNNNRWDNLDI